MTSGQDPKDLFIILILIFFFTNSSIVFTLVIDLVYDKKYLYLRLFMFKIYRVLLSDVEVLKSESSLSIFDYYSSVKVINRSIITCPPILLRVNGGRNLKIIFTPKDRKLFMYDLLNYAKVVCSPSLEKSM